MESETVAETAQTASFAAAAAVRRSSNESLTAFPLESAQETDSDMIMINRNCRIR